MKYHYFIDNTQLPKTRISRHGQQTALMVPELIDHVKTRISYLIATFKPYDQLIKNRIFKNAQEFFSRDP